MNQGALPDGMTILNDNVQLSGKAVARRIPHTGDPGVVIDRNRTLEIQVVNRNNSAPAGIIDPQAEGVPLLLAKTAAAEPVVAAVAGLPAPAPVPHPAATLAAAVLQGNTVNVSKPAKVRVVMKSPAGRMTIFVAQAVVSDTAVMLAYRLDDESSTVEPPVYSAEDKFEVAIDGKSYHCLSGNLSAEILGHLVVALPRVID